MSAKDMDASIARLFRTYNPPKHATYDCKIWEASRATSAAPTFFKRIEIGSVGMEEQFIDGGMGCNNPTAQVVEEAKIVFPNQHISLIVSIGTGHATTIAIPKPGWFQKVLPLDVITSLKQIATDCEKTAQQMAKTQSDQIYFRFNVQQGLQKVGLGDWEKLGEVATHTNQYVRSVDVDRQLDKVVSIFGNKKSLVARELDMLT
jgi:predicted acylesterase/phospholipase RssA